MPWNERARMEALHRYEVLDTLPEQSFDDITHLAAQLCGTPIALISLVDEDRHWFKSRVGMELQETPRNGGFCAHAILQPDLFVVPDAFTDVRFSAHPLVTADPSVRFYAGAPLITPDGLTLGVVCVIDYLPRQLTPQQARCLESLARQVMDQLELRRMNRNQTRLIDELRATNERFEVVLRATNDVVWDWDLPNARVTWNERISDILGYSMREVRRDSAWWYDLVHPDDQQRVAEGFRRVVGSGGALWTDEYRVRRANGTYARVLDRAAILRDKEGAPVRILGAVVDMSEREEMRSRLSQADRMASVGTLAAGVAHELNNPLAYVLANLDFARQALATRVPPEEGELPQALHEAREGAERMRLIIRDLKMFSRPDDERLAPVDVRRALDSAATMAWNEVRHRARLVKDYQPVPTLLANEARLGQVFLNLLVNAAQSIPEGAAERNEIRVSTRVDGAGRVVVEVKDTGSGIPEHIRPRILEPFFTTKAQGEGTGLGLSICHGIIKNLGGELRFESEVGKGTAFQVVLPAPVGDGREAPAEQPVARSEPKAEQPGRRGHVLVVDDEPMVVNAVKRALRAQYEVTGFNRARAALEWMERGEPWDVIVCDLMMPELTGMDFHAELSQRQPDRAGQVIFLTGGAFTARAHEFLARVDNPRLDKPFDTQALRELVGARLRAG